MAIVDELISILGYDLRGEQNLTRFKAGMEGAKRTASRVADAIGAAMIAASAAVAAGGAFMAKSVIATGAEFEKLETILTTIEGSSEKAKTALDWVQEFAKTTPYDLQQVAESFVRLRAYGLDPMSGQLESIGNAASAMGKSLMQGVEAIADAAQGENERLKEFGIRASVAGDQITYSWQQNGEQMSRTVKKNGAEIVKTLTEIFDQRFPGAMEAQSKTWNGMISNMGDVWTAFQKKIADAGFFDWMKDQLREVLDWVNRLDSDGSLDRWAKNFSDSFIRAGQSIRRMVTGVVSMLDRMGGIFSRLTMGELDLSTLQTFGVLMAGLLRVFAPITFWIVAAYLALDDFFTYMEGGNSIIGDFIAKIQDLTGVSEGVAQIFAGIGAAAGAALLAGITAIPGLIARVLISGIVALAPSILAAFVTAFGLLSNPAGWAIIIGGVAAGLAWYFWDELSTAWSSVSANITSLFSSVDLSSVGTRIAESLVTGLRSVTIAFGNVGEYIVASLSSVDLSSVGTRIAESLVTGLRSVTIAFGNVDWSSIGESVGRAWLAGLIGQIRFALTALNGIGESVGRAWLAGLIGQARQILTAFNSIGQSIAALDWATIGRTVASTFVNAMRAQLLTINGIFRGIANTILALDWATIGRTIVTILRAEIELIRGVFRGMGTAIADEIRSWFTGIDLYQVGVTMMNSLWEGMKSIGGQISAWFSSLIPTINIPGLSLGSVDQSAPTPTIEERASAANTDTTGAIKRMMDNLSGNMARMDGSKAVEQVTNDNRQDNRQFPVSTSVTVNQQVTEARAPLEAARATGQAVGNAATNQASRIEREAAE